MGAYKHEIVQEVVDGEETPMIKKRHREDFQKKIGQITHVPVTPLFHLPEGSINYETI